MGNLRSDRPEIFLFDRQSATTIDLSTLQKRADAALPLCLESPAPDVAKPALQSLDRVEISFIDDAEIARIHEQFMAIPGATDVITFDHGEIVISTETAARYADEFGHDTDRELTLYIVHGLLHLNGHEDATRIGAERMQTIQEHILHLLVPR